MKIKKLWLAAGGFGLAAGFYILLTVFGIGCPIRAVTGIPCPGCGMTRAYLSLLKLDIASAFRYHPLFWMPPLLILSLFIKKEQLARPIRITVLTTFAVLAVGVYLVRLLLYKDFPV